MTPWGGGLFPGGKWAGTECLSSPWGKNACVANSPKHNPYFIQWEIVFSIQHLFYHFSPFNHLFFNITDHWIIFQVWKNNCWQSMICILSVLISRGKLIIKYFREALGHYSDQLLGACKAQRHHCVAKSELLMFWNLLSVYRAKFSVDLLKKF